MVLILLFAPIIRAADPTIVIHWSTVTADGDPELLKDRYGNPLSIGSGGNGTGYVVTLGYFDEANDDDLANHFLGSWIPLTEGTRVGDSSTGYGFSDGMFSFTTVFRRSSNLVTVFPYEPATYEVEAPFVITGEEPEPGTPLCIRFYDDTTVGPSARYNTVTGTDWAWPTFKGGIPENYYLKIASGTAPAGSDWKYGSFFEDPDNNFTTSLELQSYLTVNVSGFGSVDSLEPSYNYGTVVPISANPDPNMEFVEWLGDGVAQPGFAQTTVTMDADRNITAVFEPKDFNVVINQTGKGSTTGAGVHPYGSVVNLTATPDTGYEFSHWEGFGPDSNVSESTTLTVQQDHTLIAVFAPLPHSISITASTGGSANVVDPPDYFYFDSNYTLFAEPDFGYSFSHWSSPSNSLHLLESQTNPLTSFIVQGDASYHANFSLITYHLELAMGEGGASVLPESGEQSALSLVSVSATALEGYEFVVWTDPGDILLEAFSAETEANMSKATGPVTVTANFQKKAYIVSVDEGEGGNVSLNPGNGPWEHFGVYELNATAQVGYTFSEWQGDAASTSSLLFGVNEARNKIGVSGPVSLTAVFSENAYSVSTSSSDGGSVVGEGNYSIHDAPSVAATAEVGWHFSHWEGDVEFLVAQNSSSSLINLAAAPLAISLHAVFSRDVYDLSVLIDGDGLVNGASEGFALTPDSATQVNLTAESNRGWHFERWYGSDLFDPTSDSISFIPASSFSLTATFEKNLYHLEVTNSVGGEANGTGSYAYDSRVSIKASPQTHYAFERWTGDFGTNDPSDASIVLTIPDGNLSLQAEFSRIQRSLSTSVIGSGSVTAGTVFDSGTTAEVVATPGDADDSAPRGYQLEKWIVVRSSGGSYNSTDNPLSLNMNSNFTVKAVFSAIPPDLVTLDLVASPGGAGSLFDDPDSRVWNVATDTVDRELNATANPGFSFLGWSAEGSLGFEPSWKSELVSISPESDSVITANFAPMTHKLLVDFDETKGTVSGASDDLPTATSRVLTAQAGENQIFHSWTIDKTLAYAVTKEQSAINTSEQSLFIDGKESPTLRLLKGYVYQFSIDLPEGETFFLAEEKGSSASEAYADGTSDSQASDGIFSFTIPEDCPEELFYCSSASPYLGGKILISSIADDEIIPFPTEPEIEPVLDFDLSLQANFIGSEIRVHVLDSDGGSVTGIEEEEIFSYGDLVEITAVPDQHFEFERWEFSQSLTPESDDETLTFTILDTLSVRPIFQPKTYGLNLLTSPIDGGNAFTTNNQYTFAYGTVVSIEVIPLPGNRFDFWSGLVEDPSSLSTTITIEGDTTVIAQFSETLIEINKEVLALDPFGNPISETAGTITGGDSFALGAVARFTAFPNDGFEFLRWEDEHGNSISTSASSNIQISGFSDLVAVFQKLMHEAQVIASPSGKGEVEWTGRGSGEIVSGKVTHGESVSLHATPIPGYELEKWTSSSGDLYRTGQSSIEVAITKPMIINARFIPINPVELSISISPENSGWTFGQGIVNQSAKYPILAKPNPGYVFDRWEGIEVLDPNAANTTINLNQDKELIAHFKEDPNFDPAELPLIDQLGIHNLRVLTADILHGSVSGSGIFGTGWAEIKAFPQKGYDFVRWTGAEVEDEYALNTFIFLSQNTEVEAIFEREPLVYGAQNLSSSWWQSDWFGTYWNTESSWLYHVHLGWVHLPEAENQSEHAWVWIDRLESWYWTGNEVYPYLFDYQLNTWIWINLEQSAPSRIVFFEFASDLKNGSWRTK